MHHCKAADCTAQCMQSDSEKKCNQSHSFLHRIVETCQASHPSISSCIALRVKVLAEPETIKVSLAWLASLYNVPMLAGGRERGREGREQAGVDIIIVTAER